MAFLPEVNQLVWYNQNPAYSALVIAVYVPTTSMLILPLAASKPRLVDYDDRWSLAENRPAFPDRWCVVTPDDVSRGFASRQAVLNNLPANAIAILHVKPDSNISVEVIL